MDADELKAVSLRNTEATFVCRAVYRWGGEAALQELLAAAKPIAAKLHKADPNLILQAAVFEIVTEQVNSDTHSGEHIRRIQSQT